jgi:CRP-like cAMP-binding protein
VHALADRKDYADFLELIPAFSTCTRDKLEEFVNYGVVKVRCAAGKTLSPQTEQEQNLYVLVAGSALLNAGDVVIELEPGDYFGREPARQHRPATSVLALTDIELLFIDPYEVARLGSAASRNRRGAGAGRHTTFSTTTSRVSGRNRRRTELTTAGR